MNSARPSLADSTVSQSTNRLQPSKANYPQKAIQLISKHLAHKYSTCENYIILDEINRTIMDKECIFKTTINDIRHNQQEQKLQFYYPIARTDKQLPELLEYYKYYSQRTILFAKEHFSLLYQYQEKRKAIEYNRLKVLLNLSDTQQIQPTLQHKPQNCPSGMVNRSRNAFSRNFLHHDDHKQKDLCGNVLDGLSLSNLSTKDENDESLLINRLRNNLSKHIGPSHSKKMSIEQLDKFFDFQNKKQPSKPFKQNPSLMNLAHQKTKLNTLKWKKVQQQQTSTNTPDEFKPNSHIRRRSANRNNSCENIIRNSVSKTPYEPATCKLKRKKNLSMDNMCTNTSTPYLLEEKRQTTKLRKVPSKAGDRYQKYKKNTLASKGIQRFADSISDLKSKIKKQKQLLMRATNGGNFTALKRQKTSYTAVSTPNPRLTKKNDEKLRERIVNVH